MATTWHGTTRCQDACGCLQFVEYQDQYDESNSDIPDGGSDSDYNSIDSGAESEDKAFKVAAQREIRAQQRAKAGPPAGGSTAASGARRQKRAPKAGPKESEFDEEEMGQLEDLIVRPQLQACSCASAAPVLCLSGVVQAHLHSDCSALWQGGACPPGPSHSLRP